jgi:protein involved in polysaccharide export with SLBB domain
LYKLVGNFKPEAFIKGIILTRQSVRERQLQSLQQSRDALNESILVKTQRGENIGNISVIQSLFQEIEPKNLGRIAGDFSPSSDASIRTVLFDGDSIIVPKNPNVINVFGEVLNPISFEFIKGLSVRNSIERAGGYKDYAHKSKVYVIKANGIIEKVNRNIFVRNVKLEAGDTIVVPRKIITNNPGIEFLLPVTQILSDMAFSAAAIESLSNN